MNGINRLNPLTIAVYYFSVLGILMFQMNPIILVIAFISNLHMNSVNNNRLNKKEVKGYVGLFLIMALVNPLFYHNGITVLFYMNNNPVTLEAVVYGVVMAFTLIVVLRLCAMMSKILSSDKIMYLVGKISKKAALIISMSLKFIPQYRRQADKIREAQKVLGFYKEDTIFDKLKGNMYVFSAVLTWSLEHSMETADSMRGRAYGVGKRTQYSNYRIAKIDIITISMMLFLDMVIVVIMNVAKVNTIYYPAIIMPKFNLQIVIFYIAYIILVSIVPYMCTWEKIKWKYLAWKS